MIRVAARFLKQGDRLAVSLPNPQQPGTELLPQGHMLETRVVRLLQRIGLRTAWVESPDTGMIGPGRSEEEFRAERALAGRYAALYGKARAGEARGEDFLSFRDDAVAAFGKIMSGDGLFRAGDDFDDGEGNHAAHALAVMQLSLAVARRIFGPERPLAEADAAQLGLGALLHDIGKAQVPEAVLEKEEWERSPDEVFRLRQHAVAGFKMLRPAVGAAAANAALFHHLFIDGTGYPNERDVAGGAVASGEQVHLFGKIVCLTNAFDELARAGYTPVAALEQINCARRGQFDPEMVRALNACVPPFPEGAVVTLSSGHSAAVVGFNPADPFRPPVVPLFGPGGAELNPTQRRPLDLAGFPKVRVRAIWGVEAEHLVPGQPGAGWEDAE